MSASNIPPQHENTLKLCHYEFKAMGSPCSINIYAENEQTGRNIIQQAFSEISRLEDKFSRYKTNNDLFHINQAAEMGTNIHVDDEFLALLNYADTCYQQSDGLFDITAGALRRIWNFDKRLLPSDADIKSALNGIGWQHVKVENNVIHFLKQKMEIDFGGIVKEYAADSAAALCAAKGISHGVINLGGDIKAIGPHPNGQPWSINIRDPLKPGQHMGKIDLYHEGLATSGDYERFFEIDGKRYCHILSPKTGWPVTGLSSVTVKAEQCVIAGSASTIAMLLEDKGVDWLEQLGVECLWQATLQRED